MQILINASKPSLDAFKRATGVDFAPLDSPAGKDSAAVVVQGNSFEKDISASIRLGIPVVVVAGNDMKCAEQAAKHFIPESCIILKQGDSVVTVDGKKIADTVGGGIGVRAVVKAAEYAIKNKLCPEPLVWVEPEPFSVLEEDKKENNVISLHAQDASAGSLLDLAKKIVVVFKATPDAESGKAAHDLAICIQGIHAELASKPCSYTMYGKTIEEAAATNRYVAYNGKTLTKGSFLDTEWLVTEIDTDILATSPELVDNIYKKAVKIVHVVGDYEKGKTAIDAWLSSWRLDAIVPSEQNYHRYKKVYGDIVITDIGALASQLV